MPILKPSIYPSAQKASCVHEVKRVLKPSASQGCREDLLRKVDSTGSRKANAGVIGLMKLHWAVMPLLAGIAVFGIFKSLELTRNNGKIQASLEEAQATLAYAQADLKTMRSCLDSANNRNEMLMDDVAALKKKIDAKEREVQDQIKKIAVLTQNFQEVASSYVALAQDNQKRSNELVTLAFENAELKNKVASGHRQVKAEKKKKAGKSKPSKVKAAQSQPAGVGGSSCLAEAISLAMHKDEGNEGFVVKDGQTTYGRQVEITVEPEAQ